MQCGPKSLAASVSCHLAAGCGGLPAKVADRRRGVGDALEGANLAVGREGALYVAFVGLDFEGVGGEGGGGDERQSGECKG